MAEKTFHKEIEIAKKVALETWPLIAPFYDKKIKVTKKEDDSPVTEADKLASKHIIKRLSEEFPKDSIISEEDLPIKNGNRTWYIDPIDGTKGFIKRNGQFAIHIGFCENESPTLGVVYWPTSGDLYYGTIENGAYRQNSRGLLKLKAEKSNRKELIASTNGDNPHDDLKSVFKKLEVMEFHNSGSDGLRLMKIAENRADIRISEKIGANTWDLCAPHAILRSIGCYVQYIDGKEIKYKGQGLLENRYIAAFNLELLIKAKELMEIQKIKSISL